MNEEAHTQSDEDSRRSFLKKGALASGAVALGLGSAGTADAQETPTETPVGDTDIPDGQKALVFTQSFRPFARFAFVSGVIDWSPDVDEVEDNIWSEYNTRMIRYLNTGEQVPLFVAQDAEIGEYDEGLGFVVDADDDANQPQVFEMDRESTLFGDSPMLTTVNFSPVGEEEEDDVLDNEDWWQQGDGGGRGG